jgi:nitric oxide reductase NorQ protein
MVRSAALLRANYKKGDLPYAPSVGDLINWATLVADGLDVYAASEETIVSTTSDDTSTQEIVRRIIRAAGGVSFKPEKPDTETLV